MDDASIITWLVVAVVLLSVAVFVILTVVVILVVRINKIVKHIQAVTSNVAEASEWLSPGKVVSSIIDIFRK
jgi:hypothetical protein